MSIQASYSEVVGNLFFNGNKYDKHVHKKINFKLHFKYSVIGNEQENSYLSLQMNCKEIIQLT